MGKKIFISYKYSDTNVKSLNNGYLESLANGETTARHYVDEIQNLLDRTDNINKGEKDDEDLSGFKDNTIASKLRDKIYDSSVTVVVISKGMKELGKVEEEQWIPWEISYSLSEYTRNDRASRTNAVLCVVLPDRNGSYDYFFEKSCQSCGAYRIKNDYIFKIMSSNTNNLKNLSTKKCSIVGCGKNVYAGYTSYMHSVKWDEVKLNINKYINIAVGINNDIDSYNIFKSIS